MSTVQSVSFKWVIWSSSRFNQTCNLPWHSEAIRSLPSSFSDPIAFWLALVTLLTGLSSRLPLRCTLCSMFSSLRSRRVLAILLPIILCLMILQTRSVVKGTRSISQGLIKWSNLPRSLATWEDLEFLRQQFPCATVRSRPGAQGEGVMAAPSTVPRPEATGPRRGQAAGSSIYICNSVREGIIIDKHCNKLSCFSCKHSSNPDLLLCFPFPCSDLLLPP